MGDAEEAMAIAEAERVRILERFEVLDTLPELEFDEIVRLASEICEVPMALMSLVDANRQWFKSAVGLDVKETPRSVAFCAHAIQQTEIFDVADAKEDARFSHNPLVTGSPHIRFYAGAPLRTVEGAALGTLCVLDRVPRVLSALQRHALRILGDQIQARLELRRSVRALARKTAQLQAKHDLNLILQRQSFELRSFLVHDLKNVLGAIAPNAAFVLESATLTDDERFALTDLREGAERMKNMLNELLRNSRSQNAGLELRLVEFDIGSLIRDVERVNRRRVNAAGQTLRVPESSSSTVIRGEADLIRRVLDNLVDNALKYGCGPCGTLSLEVRRSAEQEIHVIVSDEGSGVPLADRERIFERDVRLDGTEAEGFGIGLAFCRAAVEAHGGEISVEDNEPRGARFVVRLPTGMPSH